MKLSAAELVKASKVAFMVSEPSYWKTNGKLEMRMSTIDTYNTLFLNDINSWIDITLCNQCDTYEHIDHTEEINQESTSTNLFFGHESRIGSGHILLRLHFHLFFILRNFAAAWPRLFGFLVCYALIVGGLISTGFYGNALGFILLGFALVVTGLITIAIFGACGRQHSVGSVFRSYCYFFQMGTDVDCRVSFGFQVIDGSLDQGVELHVFFHLLIPNHRKPQAFTSNRLFIAFADAVMSSVWDSVSCIIFFLLCTLCNWWQWIHEYSDVVTIQVEDGILCVGKAKVRETDC